jgi:hypothetical protein
VHCPDESYQPAGSVVKRLIESKPRMKPFSARKAAKNMHSNELKPNFMSNGSRFLACVI